MVDWVFIDELAKDFAGCKIVEGQQKQWCYQGRAIAWERSLSKKDMALLADKAPKGRVLAVHMPDLETRDAWASTEPACFVSDHFKSYPAVLVDLEVADDQLVRELFDEGLEAAKEYLAKRR